MILSHISEPVPMDVSEGPEEARLDMGEMEHDSVVDMEIDNEFIAI